MTGMGQKGDADAQKSSELQCGNYPHDIIHSLKWAAERWHDVSSWRYLVQPAGADGHHAVQGNDW